jgi:hypothetical protein
MSFRPANRFRSCRLTTGLRVWRKGAVLRRGLLIALLALVALLATPAKAHLEISAQPEFQLKAAFIYNFMKFVEWPGGGPRSPSSITLGVLGRNPFGDALESFRGKLAKGRKVVVMQCRKEEEARQCDILFISESEKPRLDRILSALQSSNVLTVGDQDGFCDAGGMINMVSVHSKIAFDINFGAAKRAGLHISSQLLNLARTVMK